MDYGDQSYDKSISRDMLEDIRGGNQSYLNVNRREANYKYVIVFNKDNRNGKER